MMFEIIASKYEKTGAYSGIYETYCLGLYDKKEDAERRLKEFVFSYEDFIDICKEEETTKDIIDLLNKKRMNSFCHSETEELENIINDIKMNIFWSAGLYWKKSRFFYQNPTYTNIHIVSLEKTGDINVKISENESY